MTAIRDLKIARLERAKERRTRMASYCARNFEDAERCDLAYWQSKTPQDRLSALVAIREDVCKVGQARREYEKHR